MAISFITAAQRDSLVRLYIAYFNRAPETAGLNYWTDVLIHDLNQGLSQSAAYTDIANQFYSAAIQYSSITGYSEFMTSAEFVTKIYANVLSRPTGVSAGEINYWVTALSGTNPNEVGVTRGTLIQTMVNEAMSFAGDPTYGFVAQTLINKVAVAEFFAQPQYSGTLTGNDAVLAGARALANVTSSAASVTAAEAAIVAGTIQNPTPVPGNFAVSLTENTSITAHVVATDNNPVTYSVATGPSHGIVTLNPDGSYTYTPNAYYSGTDTFTYSASDGNSAANGTVSITVNPVIHSLIVNASATTVNEGQAVTFAINTTNVPAGTVLNYTLSGVTAGDVSVPLVGTVAVGSNGQAVLVVPNVADNITDGNKVLTVAFTSPTVGGQAVVITQAGAVTVVDTSKQYTATVTSPSVLEGNAGTTTALSFVITLNETAKDTVVVNYASANGTASSLSDYSGVAGSVTIAAGQQSATVLVPVQGDNTVENDETLTLTVSPATAVLARVR